MTKVLVTGATGFVGNAVARALLNSGREVRVLVRKSSDPKLLQGLKVEKAQGDLRDPQSLASALSGCQELYHVAAQYTFYNPNPKEIYESNVQGTHNILNAAMKKNLSRIVYTSTVGAIGIPKDGSPGNEDTPITLFDCQGHYKRSKFLAEQEAMSFYRKGLPVVIVNPSAPIGFGDAKPTPTGKMIVDFLNRKMPAYLDTGLNLIDVEDCALGHILAAEKGRPGQRYILGNQNLTLQQILREMAVLTGLSAPKIKIPHAVAMTMAHFSEAVSRWTKRPPMVEKEAVLLARKRMFFHPSKAVEELGLPQPDVRIALKKAIEWYLEHGYVKEKIKRKILDYHPAMGSLGMRPALDQD
ncbi:MAG: NAD-dependent epimerase/dehydratase family protein [bacterium]|nr:NAD-dependent epimerase/dehydratase family protein [bacterium]